MSAATRTPVSRTLVSRTLVSRTLVSRTLILGGTVWLGREIARAALARGHEVTCVARGESGEVPAGVTFVRANRDDDDALKAVATEHWDAVVDVGRTPGHVRRAVRDLASAGVYIFVSTGNVYADQDTLGQDEDASLLEPLDTDTDTDTNTNTNANLDTDSLQPGSEPIENAYGRRKVACERAVLEAFGTDRSLIARSGFIAGPGDATGRTGYWPLRFAHPSEPNGTVLIPNDPELSTQVADVRDLAAWLALAAEGGITGVFNAMGDLVSFAEHIQAARRVAGHTGPLAAAPSDWLLEHGVEEFVGPRSLPFWLADPEWRGFMARDNQRAKAAGLTLRPLDETLTDVLAWETEMGVDRPRNSGLSPADERELIAELSAELSAEKSASQQ